MDKALGPLARRHSAPTLGHWRQNHLESTSQMAACSARWNGSYRACH